MAIGISFLLFLLITGFVTAFGYLRYVRPGEVYQDLQPGPGGSARPVPLGLYSVTSFVQQLGRRLPADPQKASRYGKQLLAAGYRSTKAPAIYYGLKAVLAAVFAILGLLMQTKMQLVLTGQLLYIAIAVLGGFRLPDFVLARRVKERQRRLRRALPDALDLMIVCSEAGSAIDRALRLVARELEEVHPEFSDEMGLMILEVAAGTRRREALENMAVRTQEPEVRKFVTVLVQADRFGTEVSGALRTHADYLRVRRRLDAEEKAGKVSVKLVFPIFLFILPCMLLVTVGPAAIEIWKTVLPAIRGE